MIRRRALIATIALGVALLSVSLVWSCAQSVDTYEGSDVPLPAAPTGEGGM
jgi:hypothetical protein